MFKLLRPILFLYLIFSFVNGHAYNDFFIESGKIKQEQAKPAPKKITVIALKSEHESLRHSYSTLLKNRQRLNKSFLISLTPFNWKSSLNEPSTFKDQFLIYHALLSLKIPDPRIPILSSRSHPPTV